MVRIPRTLSRERWGMHMRAARGWCQGSCGARVALYVRIDIDIKFYKLTGPAIKTLRNFMNWSGNNMRAFRFNRRFRFEYIWLEGHLPGRCSRLPPCLPRCKHLDVPYATQRPLCDLHLPRFVSKSISKSRLRLRSRSSTLVLSQSGFRIWSHAVSSWWRTSSQSLQRLAAQW